MRGKIVEMQKCCSPGGNLISHLSSPNHNCVYLNWDSKCYELLILKRKEPSLEALITKLKRSSYFQVTIVTVKSQSA